MIPIDEIKKITQINNLELFVLLSDENESEHELYVAYGRFHDNKHYETRYGLIKNNVPEGVIICWKDNPFEMNSDYDLILKI